MLVKQFNCIEGNKIDLRQANAVLKYKPDIIIQEAPSNSKTSDSVFNKYSPANKPLHELKKINTSLKHTAKKYPWHLSCIYVNENIQKLWESGHDVKIYNIDAPSELLQQTLINKWNQIDGPHRRGTHLIWWAYIYLRELIMAKYISKILTKNKNKKGLVVLILMQKFHWRNVQFQLSNKKNNIWKYYFGKFKDLSPKDVEKMVKKENSVLYKYWKRKF